MDSGYTNDFIDPSGLAKWTRTFLYLILAVDIALFVSAIMEYQLLTSYRDGAFDANPAEFDLLAESNDLRQSAVGIAYLVVFIATVVLFAKFIYRASYNLRSFGAQGLRFTPGWAVGWYFIPIANLWKPYQAMKEVWNASVDPVNWESMGGNSLLNGWWFFWIVAGIASQFSFRTWQRAESLEDYIRADVIDMVTQLISFPLDILAIILIGRVAAAQMESHQKSGLAAVFGD